MKTYIFYLAVIALFISACSDNGNKSIKSAGIIDGEIISIKSMVNGKVDRLFVDESMKVQQGDTLAQIDHDKLLNNLNELKLKEKEISFTEQQLNRKLVLIKANIEYLKKQVNRYKRLSKNEAVSGDNLETMELKLLEAETSRFDLQTQLNVLNINKEQIKNQMEYLRLRIDDHIIQSPTSGVVLETFISEGETVFPGSAMADILNTTSLYVEVFLEEGEMSRLKLNQDVQIVVDGQKDKFNGIISYFGRKAEFSPKYIISEKERKNLLYQVKVKLSPEDSDVFKIGMPVTVIL